jgi:hypothetical protein
MLRKLNGIVSRYYRPLIFSPETTFLSTLVSGIEIVSKIGPNYSNDIHSFDVTSAYSKQLLD